MSKETISYFEKAVMKYSKGDIKELIDGKIKCAGPLLSVIVNGIDLMGGICFGFSRPSSDRSIKFMKDYMNIKESVANVLYKCVRCGIAHQGMPKIGLKFFLMSERFQPGVILYKSADYALYLNVTEFAFSYLDAIERIALDQTRYINDFPKLKPDEENFFFTAFSAITNDISELCSAVAARDRAEEEAKFARGEIESMSSCSAYFPDNTLHISLAV